MVGVQSQQSFGLKHKLYFTTENQGFEKATSLAEQNKNMTRIGVGVELELPMWKNGFGENIKYQKEALLKFAKSQELKNQFELLIKKFEAEKIYIEYAYLQSSLDIQKLLVEQGERLLSWVKRQFQDRLLEEVHVAQAEAALESRKLVMLSKELKQKNTLLKLKSLLSDHIDQYFIAENIDEIEKYLFLKNFAEERKDILALQEAIFAETANINLQKESLKPEFPKDAAVMGANEVAMAVVAVTLAVVSMFGPVVFLQGVTGQFFREFGLVVCFAVLVSLYDAMAVAPMLSAYMGRAKQQLHNTKKNILAKLFEFIEEVQTYLERFYEKFLLKSLKRPILTICCVVVLAVTLSFSASRLPSGFLPTEESQEFLVRIEMPSGTHLDATEKLALQVDNLLKNKPFIEYTVLTIGNAQQEINKADIFVMLKPSKERTRTKPSLLRGQLRDEFAKYENLPKGAEIRVMQNDISGAGQRPFNLLIQTKSSADLEKVARPIFEKLKSNSGLISPDLELKSGAQEIQIKLHEKESQHLGITPGNAGMELRARIEGLEIGKLSEKGFEYPIKVIAFDSAELWLKQNQQILVPNVNMTPVDLRKAVSFTVSQSSAKIERVNRAYSGRITADLAGNANLGEIMEFIDQTVKESAHGLNDVNVLYEGDAESYEEMAESMSLAFLSGIILLFLVLSGLYESFLLSFLNIITLPFAISGAFLSLRIFGEGVNIFSVIGILLLLGVATKNSILLIDTAQERLKLKANETDKDDRQQIVAAAVRRLRPILMTSLALIAGAIPIAIGLNEASAQRTGMGVAIVGGTVTSTLFTLVLILSVIILVVKVQEKLLKLRRKDK